MAACRVGSSIRHASEKCLPLPHPSATQLSLSKILLGSQAQLGEYDMSWERGASGSPMMGRCWSGLWEGWRNSPCPRVTQFSLSWISPRPWQCRATRSWEVGAARYLEVWASGSPVRRRHQSSSWESGGNSPHTLSHATQLLTAFESSQTSILLLKQMTSQQVLSFVD